MKLKSLSIMLVGILLIAGFVYAAEGTKEFNFQEDRFYNINPSKVVTKTAAYTATISDHMIKVNPTTADIVITLPAIKDVLGSNPASYIIQNIGTLGYVVTVTAATTDSVTNYISGQASRVIPGNVAGGTNTLNIRSGTGYNWNVLWESPPFTADMYANAFRINKGTFLQKIVTTPTVSAVLTYADCGKVYAVAVDAALFTLPAATGMPGCQFTFINTAAAGAAILDVKMGAADFYAGYFSSAIGSGATYSTSTGLAMTLSNTKSTSKRGDSVTLLSIGTTTWMVSGATGTWALK
jgi:hypothetical protein